MGEQRKPTFVLFGASMTEWSILPGGWGSGLANIYIDKADIIVRGFSGWNTRRALTVLEKLFPKDSSTHPALVVVFFGANDARLPDPSGMGQHVPLNEFKDNLRHIATYLKGLSRKTRVILVTAPPIDEERRLQHNRFGRGYQIGGSVLDRTNKTAGEYAEACVAVANEVDVEVVNLWVAIHGEEKWQGCMTRDGMHLSPRGNTVLLNELLWILRKAKWTPSLHWEEMQGDSSKPLNPKAQGQK